MNFQIDIWVPGSVGNQNIFTYVTCYKYFAKAQTTRLLQRILRPLPYQIYDFLACLSPLVSQ